MVGRNWWIVAAIVAALAIGKGGAMARGIRNHNPGNIRAGDNWQGMAGIDPDGFVIFRAPEYGVRAMQRILNSYRRRGINTVRGVIETWAPPSENNTAAYVQHVSQVLGVAPDEPLSPARDTALISAIIKHENGAQPYSRALIEQGQALA